MLPEDSGDFELPLSEGLLLEDSELLEDGLLLEDPELLADGEPLPDGSALLLDGAALLPDGSEVSILILIVEGIELDDPPPEQPVKSIIVPNNKIPTRTSIIIFFIKKFPLSNF